MIRVTISALLFGLVVGACGDADEGDDDGASEAAGSCEHGTSSACACSDGSMGTQLCAHDTSGFEECICGGNEDASGPDTMPGTDDASTSAGDDPSTTEGGGPDDTTNAASTTATSGPEETGPIGSPPSAMINHPGTEDRQAGVPIPFIGVADDPEDGALAGMSLVWTDDLEGVIGQGEQLDVALDTLGDHTVTLTATDADDNAAEDSMTFAIVP